MHRILKTSRQADDGEPTTVKQLERLAMFTVASRATTSPLFLGTLYVFAADLHFFHNHSGAAVYRPQLSFESESDSVVSCANCLSGAGHGLSVTPHCQLAGGYPVASWTELLTRLQVSPDAYVCLRGTLSAQDTRWRIHTSKLVPCADMTYSFVATTTTASHVCVPDHLPDMSWEPCCIRTLDLVPRAPTSRHSVAMFSQLAAYRARRSLVCSTDTLINRAIAHLQKCRRVDKFFDSLVANLELYELVFSAEQNCVYEFNDSAYIEYDDNRLEKLNFYDDVFI